VLYPEIRGDWSCWREFTAVLLQRVNPRGVESANVYEANTELPTGILKDYGLGN